MRNIFKKLACLIIALVISSTVGSTAFAQEQSTAGGLFCSTFDGPSENWVPCPHAPAIKSEVDYRVDDTSDGFLKVTDKSGASALCSAPSSPYKGDWLAGSECQTFCFDSKIIYDSDSSSSVPVRVYVVVMGTANRVVFRTSNPITDSSGTNPGWHTVCAPVKRLNPGDPLPTSPDGTWEMWTGVPQGGTQVTSGFAPIWNGIFSNVQMLQVPIDFTSSPSEIIGYDNFCLGGECISEPPTTNVDAVKTCDQATYNLDGSYDLNCTITVDLDEPAPVQTVIHDQFSVGGSLSQLAINSATSSDAWTCGHSAVTPGATTEFACVLNAADVPVSGQSTIDVNLTIPADTDITDVKNCSSGKYTTLTGSGSDRIDESCVEIVFPPEPPAPNCVPFKQGVFKCDDQTGSYIVELTNTALPNFNPNDVRIVSTTPGVIVSQNPSNPLELAITGATAGQVITIKTEAVDVNGGKGKGIDLCCMGEMEITIPEDMPCDGPIDVSVAKEWINFIDFKELGYDGAQVPPHGFKVTIDLPTGTLQPGDVITVNDPVSNQVNVTSFGAPLAPAPWVCSITGGAWTCTYTIPSRGAILPVDIYWPAIKDGSQHVKNCADTNVTRAGKPLSETTMANNQSCWEENKPIPDADLEIVKSGPLECRTGEPCVFTYTVNNTGSGDFNDSITLDDTVTTIPPSGNGGWSSSGGGFVSISPALCPIDDLTSGIGCSGAVSIPAGGSQVFTVTYNPPIFTGEGDFAIENCVGMLSVLQPLGDDPLESCHVTEITNPQLEIVKSGPAECFEDQPCDFTVTINNTSTDDYAGTVLLSDMTDVSQFVVSNVTPMPAGCGGSMPANPFACVTDISLAAGASTSYTFSMTPMTHGQVVAESGENCARLGALPEGTSNGDFSFQYYGEERPTVTQALADLMQSQAPIGESCVPLVVNDPPSSDDSDVTIVKTCDPLQVNPNGPDTVQCQLTVTGTNLTPGSTITINDELFSQASPGNNEAKPVTTFLGQSNISSSEPWVCTDTSTSAPYSAGNCQISTDDLIAAGGASVISTSSQIIAGGGLTGDLQNCAQVDTSATAGTGYTSVDPNTASCVWLSADCADGFVQQNGVCVPSVGNPNFAVTKSCGDATQIITGEPHFSWGVQCTISVTANPVPTSGTITIADVAGFALGDMTVTSSDPWTCTGSGATESCEIAAADFPSSGTSVLTADVNVSDLLPGSSFQNCANLSNSETNLQLGSCTDVTLPTNENADDNSGVLNVAKTCSAQPRLGAVAAYVCEINVTATGPVTGPINLLDQLTYSNVPGGDPNAMMGQMTSNDPWACTTAPYSTSNAANCSISAADFAATGYASSVYVVVQAVGNDLGEQDIQNCATGQSGDGVVTTPSCAVISTATPGTTPEFNVFKECGPITLTSAGNVYPLSMSCVIKLQPLTPFTGSLVITDVGSNLSGGGQGVISGGVLPSHPSVTCSGTGLTMSCTADPTTYPIDGSGTPMEVQIPLIMSFQDTGGPVTWQNCAGGNYTFNTGTQMQVTDYCVSQSYTPPAACTPTPEIAGDGIDNDCDGEVDEAPVVTNPAVLNVTKTCSDVFVDEHALQGAVQCSITMTGNNLPSGQVITLHDAMTASNGSTIPFIGNFANVTGAPIPVNCSDTAPATGQCTITTDDFNAAQPLTLNWSTTINGDWDTGPDFENGGTLENCAHATVAPHPTVPPSTVSPQSCATINVTINEDNTVQTPLVTLPAITLEKGSTGPCSVNVAAQNYRCGFDLTVTNNGSSEFNAPMVLNDVFGSPKPSSISGVDGSGWDCTTKGRDGTSCINGALKLAPQETSKVSMQLIIPGQRNGGEFGNCGMIGVGDDPIQQAMIAQTALNQIGFDVGAVDGKIGPNTRKGLQGLQKQLGLEPNGELSPAFFNAIGLQMAADAPQSCVTVELPPMPAPPLVCQASTTSKKGNKCVCRYKDMYQKNKSSCGCVKGTRFVKGEGCKKVVINKPQCDRTTTVAKGNSCQCRYSNMYKKNNKTSCGCVKGTKFVKGEGCIKQKVEKPKVDKPKNKCPFGTIPLGALCIKIRIPIGGGGGCSDATGVDC